MKVTGLSFKKPMVLALLREAQQPGTGKTQTRRVIKRPLKHPGWTTYTYFPDSGVAIENGPDYPDNEDDEVHCHYGRTGDLIYVRETMRVIEAVGHGSRIEAIRVRYEADGAESGWIKYPERLDSSPKLGQCLAYGGFREASRLTLPLKEVRVQQVQEISRNDAIAEGLYLESSEIEEFWRWPAPHHEQVWLSPVAAYQHLWDSINASRGYGWKVNPWVWALSFEAIQANVDDVLRKAA